MADRRAADVFMQEGGKQRGKSFSQKDRSHFRNVLELMLRRGAKVRIWVHGLIGNASNNNAPLASYVPIFSAT